MYKYVQGYARPLPSSVVVQNWYETCTRLQYSVCRNEAASIRNGSAKTLCSTALRYATHAYCLWWTQLDDLLLLHFEVDDLLHSNLELCNVLIIYIVPSRQQRNIVQLYTIVVLLVLALPHKSQSWPGSVSKLKN